MHPSTDIKIICLAVSLYAFANSLFHLESSSDRNIWKQLSCAMLISSKVYVSKQTGYSALMHCTPFTENNPKNSQA